MDSRELQSIISKVRKENEIFANKAALDSLSYVPSKIIGRKKETKNLVRYLWSYKKGFTVPLISVFGRSGTGKSTLIKFVCEKLGNDVKMCFVNLRLAKTVFGAANLILSALDQPNLKSAQGLNLAIDSIAQAIESTFKKEKKRFFILVLDEFDVLFYDKRGKPSDFVYKLVEMQTNLNKKKILSSIITISNNVLSDYELDDRVKSRIGTSEVFFEPYSYEEIFYILHERAKDAFKSEIDKQVLVHCAKRSYEEHGDARRAIDLLRVAAELASSKNEKTKKSHVNLASTQLQKDRVEEVLASAPFQQKIVCYVIAERTYGKEKEWHSTAEIYKRYCSRTKEEDRLSHRRISEYLIDFENSGLVISQTGSRGRRGYGSQFKLIVEPEIAGKACFPDEWKKTVKKKKAEQNLHDGMTKTGKIPRSDPFYDINKIAKQLIDKSWD